MKMVLKLFAKSSFLAILIGFSTSAAHAQTIPSVHILPLITLTVGGHSINAEVADNDADRTRGLMFRTSLKSDEGMLFVFNHADARCFWMRNTKIPLSIAFIDETGVIVNIDEMQPETLNAHCSVKPARYALEMNSGWYTSKGIKSGMKISGLPSS